MVSSGAERRAAGSSEIPGRDAGSRASAAQDSDRPRVPAGEA